MTIEQVFRNLALVVFACLLCGAGKAEPPVADRPGEIESTSIVPKGVFQLDLSAGVGLNRAAPDFFIGAGLS